MPPAGSASELRERSKEKDSVIHFSTQIFSAFFLCAKYLQELNIFAEIVQSNKNCINDDLAFAVLERCDGV